MNKIIDLVKRKRRRSNKLSINAIITRQLFRKEVRKTLFISTFINDYNYNIRNIDLTNQYKIVYEIYKLFKRNWFCILLILLNIIIVNNY